MLLAVALVSIAAGAAGGAYFTHSGYQAKLEYIRSEVLQWEGHYVAEVRTFAARIKALL